MDRKDLKVSQDWTVFRVSLAYLEQQEHRDQEERPVLRELKEILVLVYQALPVFPVQQVLLENHSLET